MILAQITDTHIKSGGRLAYGRVDTVSYLRRTVAHINAFLPRIDAVICSGDLTDSGSEEDFRVLRPLLDELRCPYYLVPGNHDSREGMRKVFPDHAYLQGQGGTFIAYAIEDHPLRLVGLDSSVPGASHGELGQEQCRWLEDILAARPESPTLVFLHHPPFLTGIRHMDVQNLRDGDLLTAICRRHGQVRHIACGHVHRAIETAVNGVPCSIAPSGAHAVTLALDPEAPPSFVMEPPAVRLFRLGQDGGLISHLSYIGAFDGPHPFFTESGQLID
ncbi:phosphodiesterase [Telmatospirillum sp. J64-1]|uniref:phosphodiesterase n=1 Tax=Telmatospirillum sp. J64-1 TaxID=2502183 RepID=UPI00115DE5BC|nr:phosphodiesterase [Telmatospirillum sp. J64-1]